MNHNELIMNHNELIAHALTHYHHCNEEELGLQQTRCMSAQDAGETSSQTLCSSSAVLGALKSSGQLLLAVDSCCWQCTGIQSQLPAVLGWQVQSSQSKLEISGVGSSLNCQDAESQRAMVQRLATAIQVALSYFIAALCLET